MTFYSVQLIKHRLGVDDALDVSSVHGVSGIIGSLGVGLLASPAADPSLTNFGAFYGGGLYLLRAIDLSSKSFDLPLSLRLLMTTLSIVRSRYLLRAQVIGVCVAAAHSAVVTTLILLSMDYVLRRCFDSSLRVSAEEEELGLDVAEYGQVAHTPITEAERTRADQHLETSGAPFKRTPSYEQVKRARSWETNATVPEEERASGRAAAAGPPVIAGVAGGGVARLREPLLAGAGSLQ